jgi:hypothetical protein
MRAFAFLQVALLAACAEAFYPWIPAWKCAETGTCLGERSVEQQKYSVGSIPKLKIRQRPRSVSTALVCSCNITDSLQGDAVKSPRQRSIGHHFKGSEGQIDTTIEVTHTRLPKRDNTYSIVSAETPSQTLAAPVDQDGDDYSYFTEIEIGSSNTKMYVLIDTGASGTWVMGSNCKSKACLVHNTFDPSSSTTYKSTGDVLDFQYGSGTVSGVYGTDTLSLAGFDINMKIGVANITSDDFLGFPIDGILGFSRAGQTSPGLMDALVSNKIITSKIFCIHLNRNSDGTNDGEISFGAVDTSKYTGSINYSPLAQDDGSWTIAIDKIAAGTTNTGVTGAIAYIDTGTSYACVSASAAKLLHSVIPGSSTNSGGYWLVPCDTKINLSFTFSGVTYNIPPEDWIASGSGDLCFSNFYPKNCLENENAWLLGDLFLKNVYTVFDEDQGRIGKCLLSRPRLDTG